MRQKTTIIITSLIIAISLGSILLRHHRPPADWRLAASIGQVLADETVKAIQGQGRFVIVAYGDALSASALRQSADPRLGPLRNRLKQHGRISVAAIELISPDPNANNGLPGCSAAELFKLLQRHATADAIVFLTELPEWDQVNSLIPKSSIPKLLAIDKANPQLNSHYGGYFMSGLLAALIGPLTQPVQAPSSASKTPREWFDKYYQVYTPQNADALPD